MLTLDHIKNTTLVIFHGSCPDGFGACWAAQKKLGKKALYWEAFHGEDPPDVSGHNVVLLDFCYKPNVMKELLKTAKTVTVIDHHESAMKEMKTMPEDEKLILSFDMEHSGAVLAWMAFHPNKPIPHMLQYIEDRDLWKWKLEKSDFFLSGLDSMEMTFKNFDYAAIHINEMIKIGEPIATFRKKLSESSVERAVAANFGGCDVMMVNETHKELISEVGNMLVLKYKKPALMWWYDHERDQTIISLRSSREIGVNVFELAQKFNGGGHFEAAGCSIEGIIKLC